MDRSAFKALAFFIILGTVLRIFQITFQCVWTEEEFTIGMIQNGWAELVVRSFTADFNPPLYYLTAKAASTIFPVWWAIRIPSLVAGILLIPAMYLLGRNYKDEITGVWCAGAASVLFPLVYYSQYGRAYSLLFLFFVVFLSCWVMRIREPIVPCWVFPAMWGSAILCIWTHSFSAVPVGLLCAVLLVYRSDITDGLWMVVSTACISPVIYSVMVGSFLRTNTNYPYGDNILELLLTTPGEFFGVLFVVMAMFITMALFTEIDPEHRDIKNVLFGVAIITIAIGFASSTHTPFFPRYYMTAGLILLLLACAAMATISGYIRILSTQFSKNGVSPITMAILAAIVFLALQSGDFWNYYTVQKYLCAPILASIA
jgi:mannosyltransferase